MNTARAQFLSGVKDTSPLLIGAAPFGVIYGVLATGAGIPVVMAQAISLIVFAGSAQFIAAQLERPASIMEMGAFLPAHRRGLCGCDRALPR